MPKLTECIDSLQIVHENIYDHVVEKLSKAYKQVRIGDPLDGKCVNFLCILLQYKLVLLIQNSSVVELYKWCFLRGAVRRGGVGDKGTGHGLSCCASLSRDLPSPSISSFAV